MKKHSLNNLFTWLVCILGAVAIAASCNIDGPTEVEAAQDVADYSAALADGGVALCAEFGRVPTWTKSGDLICRTATNTPPVVAQRDAL
ncbi:hypothetical protein BH10PSE16_BH10PSE16_01310 [soil metagenome]